VGTVVVKVFTTETISRGSFNFRTFLIRGGIPTHLPLVGTEAPGGVDVITTASILAINDPGEILVFFNEQLFPPPKARGLFIMSGALRIPVAITGQPTIEGKTFSEVQFSADMNNAGEVVFIARLSDGRKGIFHRAPDGTVTPVVRQFDPVPGRGVFFDFHSVLINDNGDVAFQASEGPRSGIFFVGAKGGLSRVVGLGDAAPTGGNFATIESFSLNNKGQIAFGAELSTGKSGIFIASAGLETEFVDPVPDLLAGPAVTTKEADLAKMGRVVTGIAADGAAQVVVRVKTGQAGTVEFSLTEDGGGVVLLPANSFNGSLSQVGQGTGSSTVSVPAVNVDGVGPMAFAAYHAPNDYARNPRSSEAGEKDRKAFIRIKLRTSTGETIESTESLRIVRPPVVLVHGIWSEADAWDNFAPLINDPKFFKRRVQYKKTNAAHFSVNAPIDHRQIKPRIDLYKAAEKVAAVRADVVNHSMGGLMARMLPLLEDAYFRDDNFNLGDVHKVINFGTPNFGTRFAQFLLRSSCVRTVFAERGMLSDQGAVEDLVPFSRAISQVNDPFSPLQLHQIVALASSFNKQDTETSRGYFYLRIRCRRDFQGFPLRDFFDTLLRTPDHDLIVPAFSQLAAATTNFTVVPDVIHSRVIPLLIGIGEMESETISRRVIELLHTPLRQPDFDVF
jgi:pimeloyl-ACP methyl ester carboxylesterase